MNTRIPESLASTILMKTGILFSLLAAVTYITFIFFAAALISGCVSMAPEEISRERVMPDERMIKEVVAMDGNVYTFRASADGYGRLTDSTIVGKLESGKMVKIPLSSVRRIYVMRMDAGKSASGSGFVVGLVVLLAAAIAAGLSKIF